ncbi:MAG: macro domain-containing protein [Bacteroidales bacterium]|nr:macro domain-containing protein [Bacteroidales bacterium]
MIIYKTGNLLDSDAEALVNTVNTVGIMGKGIALQFREAFPENYKQYKKAVEANEITIGHVFVTQLSTIEGIRYIINFPTKTHWKSPSRIEYIREGLQDLKKVINSLSIRSIALPPLGCGNGGLDWTLVKKEIEASLSDINADIFVYEPSDRIREILEKEKKKEVQLTPARAMMMYLLYQYTALGESVSEFAAEKLMYFLQRFGETQLKLDFKNSYFGPYSGKVRHVLYALNGKYILGYNQKQTKPFESIKINPDEVVAIKEYIVKELSDPEKERLKKIVNFIQGFQTPYALELLSTTDVVILQKGSFDISEISKGIKTWSARKKNLFPEKHLEIAIGHLQKEAAELYH